MFLKSLVIRGFKSFVERTTLSFEPGITIVVGPNGSGKSNVVDAISWVLGEQGPRSLRGGKMEDVIFAGSAKRPPLGMTEVSLSIDNTSKLLPIEFSEVTISRSLFRSGESEYRLNGTPCRLLDIQEVLSDTGVGREQHTIVGQGRLDEILNAGPEQLRGFIEEAAGVGKHRRRKERAARKIAATEGNMLRLADLLSEVRRQLRPLREQAELARRQTKIADEFSRAQFIAAARALASARAALRSGGTGSDIEQLIREGEAGLTVLENEVAHAEDRRRAASARAETQKEAAWRLARAVERLAGLARLARERGRSLDAMLQAETQATAQVRVEELQRQVNEVANALNRAGDIDQKGPPRSTPSEVDPGKEVDTAIRALEELRETLEAKERGMHETLETVMSGARELEMLVSEAGRDESGSADLIRRWVEAHRGRLIGMETAAQALDAQFAMLAESQIRLLETLRRARAAMDQPPDDRSMAAARRAIYEERLESARTALAAATSAVSKVEGRRRELMEASAHAAGVARVSASLIAEVTLWAEEAGQRYEQDRRRPFELDEQVQSLQQRRKAAAEDLERLRKKVRREDLSRAEVTLRARMLEARIDELGLSPDEAVSRYGRRKEIEEGPDLDGLAGLEALDYDSLERRRARLQRELDALGRVNLLAADQFETLARREQFLAGQLADLRKSRRDLQKVVDSVDERIRDIFAAAFRDVAVEFERLFGELFPGGRGRLVLCDPSDLLQTGVEVEARPGGKNLKRLSLLSGGERALSALAVLFAIFRARPSPFYILDEVEAALDDVNLHRFLSILSDFRESSQLLVVTHQKRTMEVADVLLGVSIGPDGASRVISERLSSGPALLKGPDELLA